MACRADLATVGSHVIVFHSDTSAVSPALYSGRLGAVEVSGLAARHLACSKRRMVGFELITYLNIPF